MKNLKKALSLTLALALSLTLAVPAFAAGSGWNLSIQGKSDEDVSLPSASYKQLSWDSVWDSEHGCNNYEKADESYLAELNKLTSLKTGDTMVLTVSKPGSVLIEAWSDPDGDGIYEQRLYEARGNSESWTYEVLPLTTASPLQNAYDDGLENFKYSNSCFLATNGQLGWSIASALTDEDYEHDNPTAWEDVTVSADYLLQQFGPNTYLKIFGYFREGLMNTGLWHVYLTDGSQPTAPAEPEQPSASGDSSSISVTVGGKSVMWTDAVPFIDANDRTMVPLRAVADAMSLTVGWDGSARLASFSDGSKTISFPIDSNSAQTSDGAAVQMDTAAVIVNDRTYAPIRYLAEYFGYTVGWDAATQTVSLTK